MLQILKYILCQAKTNIKYLLKPMHYNVLYLKPKSSAGYHGKQMVLVGCVHSLTDITLFFCFFFHWFYAMKGWKENWVMQCYELLTVHLGHMFGYRKIACLPLDKKAKWQLNKWLNSWLGSTFAFSPMIMLCNSSINVNGFINVSLRSRIPTKCLSITVLRLWKPNK